MEDEKVAKGSIVMAGKKPMWLKAAAIVEVKSGGYGWFFFREREDEKPGKKCKYLEWIDEPVTGNPNLEQELEARAVHYLDKTEMSNWTIWIGLFGSDIRIFGLDFTKTELLF
uniref:Uncharacterized protein n=1 Tax=Lactuca sativa TaxID=4236 RepID=A0A9R1VNT8_LACSA|nr:hypothetical protein LSAT_V11C500266740 [Lactuca sativa]